MRNRPSSRLLILDSEQRVLLFKFVHADGALAGKTYWATPGGGLEDGETFEEAALRELREETGIVATRIGQHVAEREFILQMPDGETVLAQERFFSIGFSGGDLSRNGWTAEERKVMTVHRWWSAQELETTSEIVFPENLPTILAGIAA